MPTWLIIGRVLFMFLEAMCFCRRLCLDFDGYVDSVEEDAMSRTKRSSTAETGLEDSNYQIIHIREAGFRAQAAPSNK